MRCTGNDSFKRNQERRIESRVLFTIIRRVASPIVGRPVGPHTMRHSFASRFAWNWSPLNIIRAAVGHANIGTTMMYVHLPSERQHEEVVKYLR